MGSFFDEFMGRPLWYDKDGTPLTAEAFCEKKFGDDPDYHRVAEDQVGPYWVSTVWLGMDHSFTDEGPPVIFETMVFVADGHVGPDVETSRYCTEEEARRGHEETVAIIRATVVLPDDVTVEDFERED